MEVVKRDEYEEIFKKTKIAFEIKDNIIDVYHRNNWDHFTIHWNEVNENSTPSYIDFFFDSKEMYCFMKKFLEDESFERCYITSKYKCRNRLKHFDDEVCKDIYSEFKRLLNSLGLKVVTKNAIKMTKKEFLNWCDRFSVGGFCGVSEYIVLIPELNIIIAPHHHMNYLIYSNNKERIIPKLLRIKSEEVLFYY